MGPLLFILYISDIPRIASEFDVLSHGYADDTQLFIPFNPFSNFTAMSDNLQRCVMKIEEWMNYNYLKLNIDKTEIINQLNAFKEGFRLEKGRKYKQKSRQKFLEEKGSGAVKDQQNKHKVESRVKLLEEKGIETVREEQNKHKVKSRANLCIERGIEAVK